MKKLLLPLVAVFIITLCVPPPSALAQGIAASATPVSSSQINLLWYDVYSTNKLGYQITRQTQVNGLCSTPYQTIAYLPALPGYSHTYQDTGLQPNTTYCYVIVVQLQSGTASHPPVNATTFLSGTSTPVPTVTPTATPLPELTMRDYHFMNPLPASENAGWKGYGGASWAFSRYTIPLGGYIAQSVNYITGTHTYSITVRASAPTTSTIALEVGSNQIATFTITRTRLANYIIVTDAQLPETVKVRTTAGGPVTLDRVGMALSSGMGGQGYQSGNSSAPAQSLELSEFTDWFQPIELNPPAFGGFFDNVNWNWFMQVVGSVMATLLQIATPQIVGYYIAGRIGIMAVLWFFGFVMQKIGKPIPQENSPVVIAGYNTGWRAPRVSALPKLPSSGIYGRRRKGSWP